MQDFLNGVCTHIIWLTQQKLTYYTGNYDTYVKTVQENEVIQQKKYEKEQDDIKHIKQFIASCGAHPRAKLAGRPCECRPVEQQAKHDTHQAVHRQLWCAPEAIVARMRASSWEGFVRGGFGLKLALQVRIVQMRQALKSG